MSGDHKGATGSCKQCEAYLKRSPEQNVLVVHTRTDIICAGKKTPLASEKKRTLQRLQKTVSALRNSGGGQIVVHIDGQEKGDKYLEHFDELISGSFSDLIEDGQLYTEAYHRQWFSGVHNLEPYAAVVIKVARSQGITTVDFSTKVNNDIEKKSPTALNIAEILFKEPNPTVAVAKLRGLPNDVQELHENRQIEIKSLGWDESNATDLAQHIWTSLKLKENLTSISKVAGGGSYYVGISEQKGKRKYKSKIPRIDGFHVGNPTEVVEGIRKKVREDILVLKDRVFADAPDDLMKIEFHELPDTVPQRYVLEVAVRYFDGIVFYDKEGPRTYKRQDDKITRVSKEEWLRRFEDRFKSFVGHTS